MSAGPFVLEWRQMRKGSLLGFARVQFPSGMIISDIAVLTAERGPWASPPGKPKIDRDGQVMKDSKGKVDYTTFIDFASREHRTRWSDAVIAAMRAAHPEALAEAVEP